MNMLKSLIIVIVIGGVAGWIAGQIMKSNHGVIINIILGLVGGVIGGALFGLLGLGVSGPLSWIGTIIVDVVGACILIWLYRKIFK